MRGARDDRPSNGDVAFGSVLFPGKAVSPPAAEEPPFFRDLNLDQLVATVISGREEYDLLAFFHLPLASVEDVEYRHAVFRDLESREMRGSLKEFGERMHRVRSYLGLAQKQHYRLEKQRWFLDAAGLYCDAVSRLASALDESAPQSPALTGILAHLAAYISSDAFAALSRDVIAVRNGLDSVEYTVRINGARVTVAAYENEADYSDEIAQLFARFCQGDVESHLVKVPDPGSMDHVEARIAELAARLFPKEFQALQKFCSNHNRFLYDAIAAFDREIQFYLAYLDHIDRVTRRSLTFCLPELSDESKAEHVEGGFDLALAAKVGGERSIVPNGYELDGNERILVVTGPNQGGKTTFARMFGQLHYLAALGVPVPAASARLVLPNQIFTHFEREEVVGSLRGKLEDELVRVRDILSEATSASVVVMNEMFASAALADALALGTDVLRQLIERGCLGVCVTFIDELSRLGEETVSMVAQVLPDDPATRTFKLVERPADGRAYAWALARKYGLSYEQLQERFPA